MWKKKPLSVMEFPDQPKMQLCLYAENAEKKNQRENKQK